MTRLIIIIIIIIYCSSSTTGSKWVFRATKLTWIVKKKKKTYSTFLSCKSIVEVPPNKKKKSNRILFSWFPDLYTPPIHTHRTFYTMRNNILANFTGTWLKVFSVLQPTGLVHVYQPKVSTLGVIKCMRLYILIFSS